MATLLNQIILFLSIVISNATDMCLWGRNSFYDRASNGLYREGPENVNGKAYWKLDRSGQDCGHSYYYIYWYNDEARWYVGFTDTGTFSFAPSAGYVAYCDNAAALLSPADCDGSWTFASSSASDVNVVVTEDRCPSLDCARIDIDDGTTAGNTGCGVYQTNYFNQTGSNVYSTDKFNLYKSLWFNEALWQWYCTDTTAVGSRCGSFSTSGDGLTQNSGYDNDWVDVSAGQSFAWDLNVVCGDGSCGTAGDTVTITCYGEGTTTTAPPTLTPNPTIVTIPTPQPSYPTLTPWPTTSEPTVAEVTGQPSKSPVSDGSTPTGSPVTNNPTRADEAKLDDSNGNLIWWIVIIILAVILLACCVCIMLHQMSDRKKNRAVSFDHGKNGNSANV